MTEELKHLYDKAGAIPLRTRLKNFMSHKDTEINLGDLTVIYSEDMGAGKTSFLEGLMYAFTGQTLRTIEKDFGIKEIIRREARSAVIQVDGVQRDDINNENLKSFYIERRRTKSSTKLIVRVDGEEISNGNNYLENMTESKTFSRITIIDGHDVLLFLKGTPKKRGEILDKLFGIDYLEKVITELTVRPIEKKIYEINNKIAENERLQAALERNVSMQGVLEELERERETLDSKLTIIAEEYEALLEVEVGARNLVNQFETNLQEKRELVIEITHIQDLLEKGRADKNSLNVKIQGYTTTIDDIKDRRFEGLTPELVITELKRRKEDIERLISTEDTVPAIIENVIEGIRNRNETFCPVCGKECEVEELEQQKSEIITLIDTRRENLQDITNNINEVESVAKRLRGHLDKRTLTTERLRKIEREIRRLESNLSNKEENLLEFIELDENVEINDARAVIDRKDSALLKGQLNEIDSQLRELSNKLSRAATTEVSEIEVIDTTALEEEKEAQTNLRLKFKDYKRILVETLKDLREKTLTEINDMINDYLATFEISVVNSVSMKLSRKTIRGEVQYFYDIETKDEYGRIIPFNGLSTGQKSAILISLILSINDVLRNKIPVVIFDEIQASGLDVRGLRTVISMIAHLARVRNIIITSRSLDLVQDIQRELESVDEEGNKIHDLTLKMYKFDLVSEGQGIPLTVVSPYEIGCDFE